MARYTVITFVDITRTNPTRSETDKLKLAQQSNFNSLLQAIGLRSNVNWEEDPKKLSGCYHGVFEGKANHWVWTFDTERDDVFLQDDDPVALLVEDLHGVPIIDQLENTVDIYPAVFKTRGDDINTWIKIPFDINS